MGLGEPMRLRPGTALIRQLRQALLIVAAFTAFVSVARAQSNDPAGLSFRSCWSVCGPSTGRSDPGACSACLRKVCAAQPRLSSHPACQRVTAEPSAAAPTLSPTPAPKPATSPAPAAAAKKQSCNIAACSARYRSFRRSDCSYQPYEGPRLPCALEAPEKPAAAAETATTPKPDAAATAPAFVDDELDINPLVDEEPAATTEDQLGCDYAACSAHYRSFRRRDCSYQPYEGPRRRCTKGDPIAALAAEKAAEKKKPTAVAAVKPKDTALSPAELAEATDEPEDVIDRERLEAELKGAFDMIGNVVAPIGFAGFAAIALLKLAFLRGTAATAGVEPAATRPRTSPLLSEQSSGWRRERASRAAFGDQAAARYPTDLDKN